MWRIRYQADTGDGRGYTRHSETLHGTRREAYARLAELRAKYEVPPGEPKARPSKATVGKAWDTWFVPDCEARLADGSLAPSTWRSWRSHWRSHVAPRWADVRCSDVRPLDVQEWLLSMTKSTATTARTVLRLVMAKAAMFGACQSSPMTLPYRMPTAGSEHSKGIYDLGMMREVARAAFGSLIEPAVLLMGLGSCRVGESLGVMCPEVSLETWHGVPVAIVPICRQMAQRPNAIRKLKNPQSERIVAVPGPPGVRIAWLAEERGAAGDTYLVDNGFGTPISQGVLVRQWDAILEEAGIERYPIRNLRNSWETNMHWEVGMQPTFIEPLMGHKGSSVTARHYDRPDSSMLAQAAAKAYAEHPFADDWDFLGRE